MMARSARWWTFKDPASPYHDIRYNTQRGYVSWGAVLKRVAGKRRVSALVGNDLRNWHRNVSKPAAPGKRPRDQLAKAIVQMMRIVLSYGKAAGLEDCAKLYAMIEVWSSGRRTTRSESAKQSPRRRLP